MTVCGPIQASGCTRAVGATMADGSIGITLYDSGMLVRELAHKLGAPWEGDGDRDVLRVAPLDTAGPSDTTFASGGKASKSAADSQAGCLVVPVSYAHPEQTVIRVPDPRLAIAQIIAWLHPRRKPAAGVHASA